MSLLLVQDPEVPRYTQHYQTQPTYGQWQYSQSQPTHQLYGQQSQYGSPETTAFGPSSSNRGMTTDSAVDPRLYVSSYAYNQLYQRYDDLYLHFEGVRKDNERLKMALSDLQKKFTPLGHVPENRGMDVETHVSRSKHDQLVKRHDSLQASNAAVQMECEGLKSELSCLETTTQLKDEKLATLREDNTRLETLVEATNEELTDLKNQSQQEITTLSEENIRLERIVKAVNDEFATCKAGSLQDLKSLGEQIEKIKAEEVRSQQDVKSIREQIEKIKAEEAQLRQDLMDSREINRGYGEKMLAGREERVRLEEEVERLGEAYTGLMEEKTELQVQNEELQKEITRLEKRIGSLTKQETRQRNVVSEQVVEISSLGKQISELKQHAGTITEAARCMDIEATKQIATLQGKNASLHKGRQDDKSKYDDRVDDLRAKNRKAVDEIQKTVTGLKFEKEELVAEIVTLREQCKSNAAQESQALTAKLVADGLKRPLKMVDDPLPEMRKKRVRKTARSNVTKSNAKQVVPQAKRLQESKGSLEPGDSQFRVTRNRAKNATLSSSEEVEVAAAFSNEVDVFWGLVSEGW